MIGKVLELHYHAGEYLLRGHHELLYKFVVGGAGNAALPQPDIERVIAQRVIIGTHVQRDRQTQLRMYARARRIQREFADRYAHAVCTQVTQAQYALAVGDHDDARLIGPVAQHLGNVAAVIDADEHAARALEYLPKLLAGQPHRWRVDNRLHLVDVITQYAKKQRLVAVVQGI